MEDKYLFRGKHIYNHEWITGDLYITPVFTYICESLTDNLVGCFTSTFTKVAPDTVGQCTSIRDKNGKLIFEGDIIRSDEGMIYKMQYHERAYCITADIVGTCSRFEYLWNLYWRAQRFANTLPVQRHMVAYIWKMITLCGIDPEKVEIMGNIFDKPEYSEAPYGHI